MSRAHSHSHSRAHFPTFPSLHLHHNSFSNPSVALSTSQLILQPYSCFRALFILNLSVRPPTSQLILQPFRSFIYVTAHSPTLPLLHLRHSSFTNPYFASPTSQDLHLIHLASRPWFTWDKFYRPICFPRNWKLIHTKLLYYWLWNTVSSVEGGAQVIINFQQDEEPEQFVSYCSFMTNGQ